MEWDVVKDAEGIEIDTRSLITVNFHEGQIIGQT
jgi:hypothetical protein